VSRADGALSVEEVKNCPGWPGEDCLESRKVAVLECVEDIPCNPCEVACPAGAITVGSPITNLPSMLIPPTVETTPAAIVGEMPKSTA